MLRPDPALSVGEQQQRTSDALPELVSLSNLAWHAQQDSPNGTGDKLVVGVAAWSQSDLELLESLDRYAGADPGVRVYVFDVDQESGAFDRIIPGVGEVFQTPVVGRWVGGVLTEKGTGHEGRQIAKRLMAEVTASGPV